MKEAVRKAIDEIASSYPGQPIREIEDGEGGAYVIVDDLQLGEKYAPPISWIGLHITFLHPEPDIYPLFLDANVRYIGSGQAANGGYPEAMTQGHKMPGFDLPAIQLSRRSHRWNPVRDTAALKLTRVLDWIRSQP
jgi:hypothetical protein